MSVVDGVADAEVTTVRGFRALSGLGRSPGVHLSGSRRWGQWVRGACRSCTFFLLTVCTLADSARCFSGHMANDNPVHSFFVVTVDTWAGVCCAVPADITHSRSILFHTVFSFLQKCQERVGPGRFFSNACTPSSHLFLFFFTIR